jgi:hypothetical protein
VPIVVGITAMATLIMAMAITDPITAMAIGHTVTMAMGVAGAISLQVDPIAGCIRCRQPRLRLIFD